MSQYTEYAISFTHPDEWRDICMAFFDIESIESFIETPDGFLAYSLDSQLDFQHYIPAEIWSQSHISIASTLIPEKNWNAEWEKDYHPIYIKDQVYLRAEFHEPKPEVPFELIIQPKMSFGTGHHETTYLMMEEILALDVEGKKVLDMGTGTGVLGIFCKMKGAQEVLGIDIDSWSFENAQENAQRNHQDVAFKLGGVECIGDESFDVIIANINKNILVQDIPVYVQHVQPKGIVLLSGLLHSDLEDILYICKNLGLQYNHYNQKNEWISIQFSCP